MRRAAGAGASRQDWYRATGRLKEMRAALGWWGQWRWVVGLRQAADPEAGQSFPQPVVDARCSLVWGDTATGRLPYKCPPFCLWLTLDRLSIAVLLSR